VSLLQTRGRFEVVEVDNVLKIRTATLWQVSTPWWTGKYLSGLKIIIDVL